MPTPLVTVLIDTYNHERFIEEVSVLEQDFPSSDVEILVVDDGSTDRTTEIVRQFEPRLRLLRKPNGGQAPAFNAGISEARGEIIAFLDGDDRWVRNKLTRVMQATSADPAVGIIGHGRRVSTAANNRKFSAMVSAFRPTPSRERFCFAVAAAFSTSDAPRERCSGWLSRRVFR